MHHVSMSEHTEEIEMFQSLRYLYSDLRDEPLLLIRYRKELEKIVSQYKKDFDLIRSRKRNSLNV